MPLPYGLREQIVVVALAVGDVDDFGTLEKLACGLEAAKPARRLTLGILDGLCTRPLPLQVALGRPLAGWLRPPKVFDVSDAQRLARLIGVHDERVVHQKSRLSRVEV